ncbi:MAG: hypothetical protein ACNA8R_01865 [Nitriliruptoraceae bacterium]
MVRERTGRGWDEWRELIDAWPGHVEGHTAVARWVEQTHGVDGWWAQQVTVGWERISGRRLPNQLADGTFTAGRSATVTVDAEALRARLLDDEQRAVLFSGRPTTLRSRPTSKNVRLALDEGVVEIAMAPKTGGRVTIAVQHQKLPSPDAVTRWEAFWGAWLAAAVIGVDVAGRRTSYLHLGEDSGFHLRAEAGRTSRSQDELRRDRRPIDHDQPTSVPTNGGPHDGRTFPDPARPHGGAPRRARR